MHRLVPSGLLCPTIGETAVQLTSDPEQYLLAFFRRAESPIFIIPINVAAFHMGFSCLSSCRFSCLHDRQCVRALNEIMPLGPLEPIREYGIT
jgi:hypothetical protein